MSDAAAGTPRLDVLVVSLGTTGGWRAAATELVGSLERAGASVAAVASPPAHDVRSFALTDFTQAFAARRAARIAIAEHQPRAIVYCSVTAALLWPAPGAVWLDATAAENRPGRHGFWQRPLERRRLHQAPLVMTMGARSLDALPHGTTTGSVLVPSPVEASGTRTDHAGRDIAALTYAGDPQKKRLEFVLDAWERARQQSETLVVAGTDDLEPRPGVEPAGRLHPDHYRALLRRTKAFVAAPRREDYGIAPLEALADGCLLVTTPAPGPYPALELARKLDQRLVTDELATAIRSALDDPLPGYADHARELLKPFSRAAVDQTIAEQVLPRILAESASASS